MSEIDNAEYKKLCSLEAKTIRVLAWVFFLPVMLVFAAFKTVRFRILLLTLAIILTSLFVVAVYGLANEIRDALNTQSVTVSVNVQDIGNVQTADKLMAVNETVYITKSGMKYHTADCHVLNGNGIAKPYGDVWLMGYSPCQKCH